MPTPSDFLRITGADARSIADNLAFWLHPEGTPASDTPVYEEQFAASINKDLEQAWAALVTDEPQAGGQVQSLPLPISALRADQPRLFYRPSLVSGVLPSWNPEVCECQQAAQTGEAPGKGSCRHLPAFFGRHIILEGFSPFASVGTEEEE